MVLSDRLHGITQVESVLSSLSIISPFFVIRTLARYLVPFVLVLRFVIEIVAIFNSFLCII